MTAVESKPLGKTKNDNLLKLKPRNAHKSTGASEVLKQSSEEAPKNTDISKNALQLHSLKSETPAPSPGVDALTDAQKVSQSLAKVPVLPLVDRESKAIKKLEAGIGPHDSKLNFIKKPAVIFIEGFSAFGISNGEGLKDMAENLPNAKRFSWNEQDKILNEIKKHSPDQPVILVGHSLGADTAVEIANNLNSLKNAFRSIDLLVTIDSVGVNNTIIPINVKRNLNFFSEGVLPFMHGDPTIARNTEYTDVINELRSELHSKMEDSEEVQFKIFNSINDVLAEYSQADLFEQIQKNDRLRDLIDSRLAHLKA